MIQNIVNSLGGGSGIDTLALVDQLVEIQSAPETQRIDTKEELLKAQLSDFSIVRSALGDLESSLAALKKPELFNAKAVDFPETTLLVPTGIEADAPAGDYQLTVGQIAAAQTLSSDIYSSPNDAVGEGTLTIRFGKWSDGALDDDATSVFDVDASKTGAVITINSSNNSLSGLKNAINDADFGVQASIVFDGSDYRLLLSGPSGENNEMELVVAEDAGAPGLSAFDFNTGTANLVQEQGGQDAELTINGLGVTRESNTIDDLIDGLSFTLQNYSASEVVSFSITEDHSLAQQSVRDFVEGYNTFLTTVNNLIGFDDELGDYGSLKTDSLAKNLVSKLRSLIGASIPGIESGYNALTNVGIRTERDGSLKINEKDFSTAFDDNFDLVTSLFTPKYTSDSVLVKAVNYNSNSVPGSYAVNITNDATKAALAGADLVGPPVSFDSTGKDYTFEITVDGEASSTITVTADTVFTPEEMAAELQSQINNDSLLLAVGETVTVTWDTDNFVITSDSFGDNSTVSVTAVGMDIGDLGITVDSATPGENVAGTINGVSGFGSGNVLLPALNTDPSGLSMIVAAGATTATLSFSLGFGEEMNRLIDDFLKSSGVIRQHTNSLNEKLSGIDDDRSKLELRTEAYRARLQAQFIAMDQIVQSLKNTGSFFDGINERLPFTAGK